MGRGSGQYARASRRDLVATVTVATALASSAALAGACLRDSTSSVAAATNSASTPLATAPATAAPATAGSAGTEASAHAGDARAPSARTPATDEPPPAGPTACEAPSLEVRGDADARDASALATCRFAGTGDEAITRQCGYGAATRPVSLARLEEAVLAFDAPTRQHLRELAARGAEQGRHGRVFGIVGDSLSTTTMFLGAFSSARGKIFALDEATRALLRTPVDGDPSRTIVDYYRDEHAGGDVDAFGAPRAAKNGAPASWAVEGDARSALVTMVERLSPSVAVVLFGTNDAHVPSTPLADIEARFRRHMSRIVDALEERGVIPVLSTLPRHGADPKRKNCDKKKTDLSDWRVLVQTNALNAVVAALACERHLPLVDLRHALDPLVNHGLDEDGVHLTGFGGGIGLLNARALQCGYPTRNFVTLLMLGRIKEELERGP